MSSPRQAELRWRIHVLERRSAAWIDGAVEQQAWMRRRCVELDAERTAAQARRRALRRQRLRMQLAMERARSVPGDLAPPAPGTVVDNARQMLGWSVGELWWAYFALGGRLTEGELKAVLDNEEALDRGDRAVLVTALNERFAALGCGRPLPLREGEP